MIAYLDSSVLARAYLSDEAGHEAVAMIEDLELALITGTWSRIEVPAPSCAPLATVGAMKMVCWPCLTPIWRRTGPVTVVAAAQEDVERQALGLVRTHAIRAMDAWHLATAELVSPSLVEPGEEVGFATRDQAQSEVAAGLGLRPL